MKPACIRRGTAALCMLLCAALLAGCAPQNASASSTGAGVPAAQSAAGDSGQFVLPYSSAEGFNPYTSKSNITLQDSRLLFSNFVDITNDYELVYNVASAVVSTGNEVSITVGGSFADGTAITGADAAASLEAARASSVFGARFANVSAVRAAGNTVTVTLQKPDSLFAYLLDIPVMKAGETASTSPTSSGRYSVSSTADGAALTANASFAGKTPFDTIQLVELSGYDALVSSLNLGVISLFSSEQESDLAGSIVCNTSYFNLNNLVFLGIQPESPDSPLNQSALRQAISLGISRRQIADKAYYSRAYVATGVINPRFPGESAAATLAEEADTAKAKALIESLGYTMDEASGFYQSADGKRLSFSLLCYTGSSFKKYAASLVADELSRIGIEVTVSEDSDFTSYSEKISSGTAPLYIGEVKLYNNMDMDAFFGTGNARVRVAPSDALLAAYDAMKADKTALAGFETAFAAEMPFVPLVYKNGVATYSKDFSGLTPTVSDIFYGFENLTIDNATQKE